MLIEEILTNTLLMLFCYAYVLIVILVSGRMDKSWNVPHAMSRKFLHVMIGNLPFIIPFFTLKILPTFVAAPFILVTLLATPSSPFRRVNDKLKALSDITEEGHHWGLVFYAVSYTCLAFLFPSKPYVIAAGILPMAYGDAAASVVGERFGRHSYKVVAKKSLEGSAAMFLLSLASLAAGTVFFSLLCRLSLFTSGLSVIASAAVATLVEGLSPMGFDNLTVPAFSVLAFVLCGGGV